MTTNSSLPAWEQQQLDMLSAQGLLSGVSPTYLAAIDQAESSGQGGGLNPKGYGGYFGLGVGSSYPAGTPSSSLLSDPSPGSFDTQAQIAASTFAQDLTKTGGDPIGAEGIYQTGSAHPAGGPSEGQSLMTDLLGGSLGSVSTGVAGSVVSGATSSVISGIASTILPLFARVLLYVAFVGGGIVLVVLGLQRLTGAKVPVPIPVPV